MENASRALIIAGEVIIALLVISLMVAIFFAFGNFSSNMHKKLSNEQIIKFNDNFTQFEGRINITAQDIVTTVNYVKQLNDVMEIEYATRSSSAYNIEVCVDGTDLFADEDYWDDAKFPRFLNDFLTASNGKYATYQNNTLYFSCNAKFIDRINLSTDSLTAGYEHLYLSNDEVVEYQYKANSDIEFYDADGETGIVKKINFHTVDPADFSVVNR